MSDKDIFKFVLFLASPILNIVEAVSMRAYVLDNM